MATGIAVIVVTTHYRYKTKLRMMFGENTLYLSCQSRAKSIHLNIFSCITSIAFNEKLKIKSK